jgi:hypothetical protein
MTETTLRPLRRPITLPVAGVSFRQDVVRATPIGTAVVIVADPTNPHDPDARAIVTTEGRLLGYVPAKLIERLASLGATLIGEVSEVLVGETWGLRVRVSSTSDRVLTAPSAAVSSSASLEVEAEGTQVEATEVLARSGRRLGTLVAEQGEVVVVATDGGEIRLPRTAVELREAG